MKNWQSNGLMLSQDTVLDALKSVKYPGFSRDIVSFGLVKEIAAVNGAVTVTMQLTSANAEAAQQTGFIIFLPLTFISSAFVPTQ
ncbi:MAG: iron-sulfur cluster assembly protein, partial [Verrucomicrobiota bacterium]